jgi:methylthioribose-1-phosphate isomerase
MPSRIADMETRETISWDEKTSSLLFIDQTKLPSSYRIVRCRTVDRLVTAIRRLEVRGAPALGIAGAYGVALATITIRERDFHRYIHLVESAALDLGKARPTAVNLTWGVLRVLAKVRQVGSIEQARTVALEEAQEVVNEDVAACHALGDYGATLLPETGTVLTHCNAGALACREWGTALGVVRSAIESGKDISVVACETRPLFQGARLTAWELKRDAIPVTVIPDSAAAHLMRKGEIDCVIVGADRITRDAVFNKIGTYMHAVCSKSHDIPFFVAAPFSTFDRIHTEDEIEIEERERGEVSHSFGHATVPDGVPVRNPAFDATPLPLVTALITEQGVIRPASGWVEIAGKHRVI